jgi:hypothetical protein
MEVDSIMKVCGKMQNLMVEELISSMMAQDIKEIISMDFHMVKEDILINCSVIKDSILKVCFMVKESYIINLAKYFKEPLTIIVCIMDIINIQIMIHIMVISYKINLQVKVNIIITQVIILRETLKKVKGVVMVL